MRRLTSHASGWRLSRALPGRDSISQSVRTVFSTDCRPVLTAAAVDRCESRQIGFVTEGGGVVYNQCDTFRGAAQPYAHKGVSVPEISRGSGRVGRPPDGAERRFGNGTQYRKSKSRACPDVEMSRVDEKYAIHNMHARCFMIEIGDETYMCWAGPCAALDPRRDVSRLAS